ncbi:MAG: hypothetical protein WBM62_14765 [Crocosphaera sp.]
MKFNKTFAAILTVSLTAGINVSAIAAPVSSETIKENRVQNNQIETVKEQDNTNGKSDKNTKPSQKGSQGNKCAVPYTC